MENPLEPSAALLAALGSIIVHMEEMMSDDGHAFDHVAMTSLLEAEKYHD